MDRRRERERARVSSLLCDRGWTEHLHHLIYDPLRCTDNKREKAPRCLACRRSRRARAHSQNKFAYGCNGCSWGKRETKGEEADRWNTDAPSSSPSKSNSSWRSPVLAGGEEGKGRKEGVRTISMSHESDTGGGIMPCSFRLVATAHGEIQRGRLNAE